MAELRKYNTSLQEAVFQTKPIELNREIASDEKVEKSKAIVSTKVLSQIMVPAFAVVAAFVIVFGLLTQTSKIYVAQKQMTDINSKIELVEKENEAMKVELLKMNAIEALEKTLTKEYVPLNKAKALEVDLSYDNFRKPETVERKLSLFEKIKNIFN